MIVRAHAGGTVCGRTSRLIHNDNVGCAFIFVSQFIGGFCTLETAKIPATLGFFLP